MKAKLTIKQHGLVSAENVIEVSYKGELVCAIYGADGPGIRVITKLNPTKVETEHDGARTAGRVPLNVTTILYETPDKDT